VDSRKVFSTGVGWVVDLSIASAPERPEPIAGTVIDRNGGIVPPWSK
jgi:hypothetical protein